jgi:hypothetical protein
MSAYLQKESVQTRLFNLYYTCKKWDPILILKCWSHDSILRQDVLNAVIYGGPKQDQNK